MPMSSKKMLKFLKKNGFVQLRQRGSHVLLKNYETNKMTTVPMHNKELKKGTENGILKQAGFR